MTERLAQYRAYATAQLELRTTGDGRTIYGIAVPYNRAMRIDSTLVEEWAPGAFNNQVRAPNRIPFARDHLPLGGTVIGGTKVLRDDALGLYGEWRVAKTAAGDDALALWEAGILRDLSIGFYEGRSRRTPGGVTRRETGTLFEVAMVIEGAYGDLAQAAGVRVAQPAEPVVDTPNLDAARAILAGLPPLR